MPKGEILDPQGQAIVGALGRLGHAGAPRAVEMGERGRATPRTGCL